MLVIIEEMNIVFKYLKDCPGEEFRLCCASPNGRTVMGKLTQR